MAAPIAVQLWTFRTEFEQDPEGVLDAIADAGYAGVEMVDALTAQGRSAAERRALFDARGLAVPSCHVFLDALERERGRVFDDVAALGARDVACAWIPPERRRDGGDYRRLAERLAEAGEEARDRSLQLAYHHHDFELRPIENGKSGLDIVLEAVHPELLAVELDVYWAHVAGLDPVAELEGLGDRCRLVHCKDHLAPGAEPVAPEEEGVACFNTVLGTGVLDFPAIVRAARHAEWLIVEQDLSPTGPEDTSRRSLDHLRSVVAAGG
jgi:sugar phosphate isomerase/epimerase